MHRSRLISPLAALLATLAAGPILATAALAADPIVVVQAGDTLTRLSRRHDVSIATLVDLNDLADPNRIFSGQRLRVAPERGSAPPSTSAKPAAARVHTVTRGQNLTVIARQYGVTVAAIVGANAISNPSRIYAGQRLSIPGTSPGASRGPSTAMPARMAALVAKRDAVRRVIVEEAKRYDVPPALALAVAWQESGWQQGVVSHAGAVGVMQLMPATSAWVGEAMLGTTVDASDTRQNVRAGVRLLAHYLARYDGDRDRVLAAYYQGQWATDHHGIYPVSRPYISSIKLLERIFAD